MTNDFVSTRPFGARFAESWDLLQRFLADLDQDELKRMSEMGASQTLELLRKQPAIGFSETLEGSSELAPEALAIEIIRSRIEALEVAHDPGNAQPWGARFLAAWKGHQMPLSAFNYALIHALRAADEPEAKAILKRNLKLSYAGASVLGKQKDPERAASELAKAWQLHQMSVSLMFLAAT